MFYKKQLFLFINIKIITLFNEYNLFTFGSVIGNEVYVCKLTIIDCISRKKKI